MSGQYLGVLSQEVYEALSPRMQAACLEMVRLGEITIEGLPRGNKVERSHRMNEGQDGAAVFG